MVTSKPVSRMICPNCRMPYVAGSPYCKECGTPLIDPSTQPSETVTAPAGKSFDRFLIDGQDALSVNQILDKASQILVFGEEIEYIATANKNVAGLVADCVIATDRRLIDFRRKMLGKTEFVDCSWRDVRHMDIKEGRDGVMLRVAAEEGWRFIVDSLPQAQAVRLYEIGAQHSVRLQIKLQEMLAAVAASTQTTQRVPRATQPPVVTQPPIAMQATVVTQAPLVVQVPQVPQTPQVSQATEAPQTLQPAQVPQALPLSQPAPAPQAPKATQMAVPPSVPAPARSEPAIVEAIHPSGEEHFVRQDAESELEQAAVSQPAEPAITPDTGLLSPPVLPEPSLTAQDIQPIAVQSPQEEPHVIVAAPAAAPAAEAAPVEEQPPILPTPVEEQPEDDPSSSRAIDDLDDLFFALLRKGKPDFRHPGEPAIGAPAPKPQADMPLYKEVPAEPMEPAEQVESPEPPVNVPTLLSYPNNYQELPEDLSDVTFSKSSNGNGASHMLDVDDMSALLFPKPRAAEVPRVNEPQPLAPNSQKPNPAQASNERSESTAEVRQAHSSHESPINKLRQLKRMLDEGLISEEDYKVKKADILSRI